MNSVAREFVPDWLFRLLQQVDGLEAHMESSHRSLSVVVNGGPRTTFEVLSIPVLSHEKADELIRTWRSSDPNSVRQHRLIATRRLSAATRELLREEGISWAEEGTGICRLFAPGLLVDVTIEHAFQGKAAVRARLRDRSGLVAEVLLSAFLHKEIRLGNLAKQARVSSALASRILARIEKLDLLDVHGAGPRRFWQLSNAGGLLDLWAAEEHRSGLTTGIYVWSRSPQDLLTKMPRLNDLKGRWALAGTSAANLYAPTLTLFPDPTVWVESRVPAREVASALGGEIADKGANLQIWQLKDNLVFLNAALWTPPNALANFGVQELPIVSPPRAYIETINATGRAPEVAQNLRQRIISDGAP